jgi:hypothetical protein
MDLNLLRILFDIIICLDLEHIARLQLNRVRASLHFFDGEMFCFVLAAAFHFGVDGDGRADVFAIDEEVDSNSSALHVSLEILMIWGV